ncbi:MAG: DUF1345 domain-containing protein [Hyphomicrobiales bacterium]
MILHSDPSRLRNESSLQDDGRIAIPILTVIAAMASMGAIIFWLRAASQSQTIQPGALALLFLTTLLSWLFTHVMFALHYAHDDTSHRGKGGGMHFPGRRQPDYWDFIYFAFVIGTSTAVSDVAVTSCTIRKTVTAAHGLVAFVFNVTMIALTVSIAGDAISMMTLRKAPKVSRCQGHMPIERDGEIGMGVAVDVSLDDGLCRREEIAQLARRDVSPLTGADEGEVVIDAIGGWFGVDGGRSMNSPLPPGVPPGEKWVMTSRVAAVTPLSERAL